MLRLLVLLSLSSLAAGCANRELAKHTPGEREGAALSASASASARGASRSVGPSASSLAPAPSFSEADWVVIRSLAPRPLPPPLPDPSNAKADDPLAAALGEKLFHEARFSGRMLDEDNDGGPNTLGRVGDVAKVSCAGCHAPKHGFSDTRSPFQEISLATGWTVRRTPSLLDVGQVKLLGWGGRHSTLFGQVFTPLESPLEMNTSRLFVAQLVYQHYRGDYEAIFGAGTLAALADTRRFPRLTPETTGCRLTRKVTTPRALPPDPVYACRGIPGDGADYDRLKADDKRLVTRVVTDVGKAIAAYLRRQTCGAGRFDAWVHGAPTALSPAEQRGLQSFIGRGKCVTCHSGPYFSDQRFHNVGVEERPTREGILNANDRGAAVDLPLAAGEDIGMNGPFSDGKDDRIPAELPAELEGAFRTPMLRCVRERPSYMHSGLIRSLDAAVAHFVRGGDRQGYPGRNVLQPVALSPDDVRDMVAFLRALDGR